MSRRRHAFDYERRHEPLAPFHVFRHRLLVNAAFASAVIAGSLAIGVVGYHTVGKIDRWVDALYEASMILGGMGPVATLDSDAAKIFASLYALYSGVVLLASASVVISPVAHRILHKFHLETEADEEKQGPAQKKRR